MTIKEIIDALRPFWGKVIASLIYILVAIILYSLSDHIIKKIFDKSRKRLNTHQAQRMNTIRSMLLSAVKYVAIIAVILAILATFGLNVSSILAGLGIMTVLLGLALQDLAKDVIAGFTIIAESQYEVGDTVEVNGFIGEVVSVGLKTTRIRDYKGNELIIANSNMSQIINHSIDSSLAEITFTVSRKTKPEKIEAVLKEVVSALKEKKIEQVTGDISYYGPVDIDKTTTSWQVTAVCAVTQNQPVERAIRKTVLDKLNSAGIEIPAEHIEITGKKTN